MKKNRLDLTIDEVVLESGQHHVDKDVLRKDIEREVTRLMAQRLDLGDASAEPPSIAEQAARQIVQAIKAKTAKTPR